MSELAGVGAQQELPAPSAETVLWRVSVECFIASVSRKRGERFLRLMANSLATEESVSNVLPIRPLSHHADVQRARNGACLLFKQLLPVFIARLR